MKQVSVFWAFLLVCSLATKAQIGGDATTRFLSLPFSARAEAVGGKAYAIIDNDVSLAWQNPSLLTDKMHHRAAFTYVNHFKGINMGAVAYARTLEKSKINLWGGINFVNYGNFIAADETGMITGNFSAGDYAITAGVSRPFGNYFNIGMNARLNFSQMAEYFSMGAGMDLAASYVSKNKLFVTSILARNVGMQFVTYTRGNREPLPLDIAIAASHEFDRLPLRISIVAHNLQKPDMSYVDSSLVNQTDLSGQSTYKGPSLASKIMSHFTLAAELYPFKRIISIRVGYNFQRRYELKPQDKGRLVGLTYGIGVRINRFQINYSRAEYFITGASPNTLTLCVDLNPRKTKKLSEPGTAK